MLKIIQKHWRKSKNFDLAFFASMLVSFFFGRYITLILNQSSFPTWNNNIFQTLILTIALIIILYVVYKWQIKKCDDLKDQQNFYDNYFISLIVVVITTFMILYSSFIRDIIFWPILLIVLIVINIPLKWLYIKMRPR